MLNKNRILTFRENSGIIKLSKLFIVIGGNKNMANSNNIIERLTMGQMKALERIGREHGYFYRNEGSQELREDGKYVVHVDFDTGCAATISPKLGIRIACASAFKQVDEIYMRGIKIWPLQSQQLF